MKGLGIIGVGAMGSALARRIVDASIIPSNTITLVDRREEHVRCLAEELGLRWAKIPALAEAVDTIIVAVKPQQIQAVLADLGRYLIPEQLVISIAAGISLADLALWIGEDQPVIRVMPNTPCLIGEGAVVLSSNANVTETQLELAQRLFAVTGKVWVLPEEQMDAVTGVSGSGPAYVYLFIEALIDGGIAAGLSHEVATELAIQTVIGAAHMVRETDEHPAVLKKLVTSPAGTTAAGLRELERSSVRGAVIEAVLAATARSRELQLHR